MLRSKQEKKESADKPGFVEDNHSSGMRVATHLKRPTRKPAWAMRAAPSTRLDAACFPIWSCSRRGLPCHRVLPPARCALTAPFHPYRLREEVWRFVFCCTFRGLTSPRRYLAPCPRSPDFPPRLRAAVAWPTPARMVGACRGLSKLKDEEAMSRKKAQKAQVKSPLDGGSDFSYREHEWI